MEEQAVAHSMWLQDSITLPDPLPTLGLQENSELLTRSPPPSPSPREQSQNSEVAEPRKNTERISPRLPPPSKPVEVSPPTQNASQGCAANGEMELVKSSLEPFMPAPSVPRATSSIRSSFVRMPVLGAGTALVSAQEFDDLRLRYSKAKRDLIRLSDIQKDLEYSRFELSKAQEEMKVIRSSHLKIKGELEEATHRADQDRRAKVELEVKLAELAAQQEKEVEFLRRQVDDLREENAKRLHELHEQQESENQMRIEAMRAELSGLGIQMDSLAAQLDDVTLEKSELETELKNLKAENRNAYVTIEELEKKVEEAKEKLEGMEQQHKDYVTQTEKSLQDQLLAQKELHERHAQQIFASKDNVIAEMKEELEAASNAQRDLEDELAQMRHKNQQLGEEKAQLTAKHEKEIRRLQDEHRLAISEKELALEGAVREAKGNRNAVQEENQSLNRQLATVNEKLLMVSSILAEREKQICVLEKDNGLLRENVSQKEHELALLTQQIEVEKSSLNETAERVSRLMAEKDAMEEEFENDIKEYKAKNRSLEATIMECRRELLTVKKEQMETADELRCSTNALRSQISELNGECTALRLTVKQFRNGEGEVGEIRRQLLLERKVCEGLRAELSATTARCQQLEERLNEKQAREIMRKNSRSPIPAQNRQGSLRAISVNTPSQRPFGKRERPEDARVLAISGLDTTRLMEAIKQLPNVATAESKSNMPVPSNVTHLITNGQLTIKLFSSLVKGCWILPERYVLDSLRQKEWLPEAEYGFQHEFPPLQNRKVFLTPNFVASRNFNTASILLTEGNAMIVEKEKDANLILCTNSDVGMKEKVSRKGPVLNWELFIESIYPQKITC